MCLQNAKLPVGSARSAAFRIRATLPANTLGLALASCLIDSLNVTHPCHR